MFFTAQGFVHAEAAPVFPIAFSHPLDFLFIISYERVRDASQGEQIGMHTPRDIRREPFPAPGLTELPGATQGLFEHMPSYL